MKILLLGYSSIAQRRIIPALTKLKNIESIDIGSRTLLREKMILKRNKIKNIFHGYKESLDKSSADVVYISTINTLHEQLALSSIMSERHVIVDKPAFLTLASTKKVVQLARKKNLGVAETTVFSFHPQFTLLKTLAKKFAPIKRIIATFTMPPFPRENYRWNKELGGGALNDLSPYVATLAREFMVGSPKFMSVRKLNSDFETKVDTAFSILADFGKNQSLIGSFGFDSEYLNAITLLGPNCCLQSERIFSTPPNLKTKIKLRHKNEETLYMSDASDSFSLMLEDILSLFAT